MQELYRSHLRETCEVIKYLGVDKTNAKIMGEPYEIACRIVEESETIKLRNEETVESTHTIYLWDKVERKDLINGKDILQLRERKSLVTGEVFGYRVKI